MLPMRVYCKKQKKSHLINGKKETCMREFPPKIKIMNIQSVLDFDGIQENFSF
jgi:hypothetical protein